MSTPAQTPIRSPSYPSMSLSDAIGAVRKIETHYRLSPVDRFVAAKLIGYSALSGPANKALAALAQFGLVERAGKGEMRVTARAQAILHPNNEEEKRQGLRMAALEPPLFRELFERWPNMIPPEDGVTTYLNRQGFNQTAIRPAAKAYLHTLSFLEESGVTESHGSGGSGAAESPVPEGDDGGKARCSVTYGGAGLGDLIQWESKGTLQFENPMRVRLVSEDGQWVVVDGSETGIPMSEVIVEERGSTPATAPPRFPFPTAEREGEKAGVGEAEWMRNRLSADTKVRLLVTGEMGPREIGKLIKLLEAQRAVLQDDDEDD